MKHLTMSDIYLEGNIFLEDSMKTVYLTPSDALQFANNTWLYHQCPSQVQWLKDIETQKEMHVAQGSNHLSFYFPENDQLNEQWFELFKELGFELGVLEFYIIEANDLAQLSRNKDVRLIKVNRTNLNDYLDIYYQFSLPYGKKYAKKNVEKIRQNFDNMKAIPMIGYLENKPVGIVDVIENKNSVEIDGFGVLENYQRTGIGRTMQSYIGELAGQRPVILVADGEDTVKDMYLKQGYVYRSFRYQILKENI
ncbi:GNAT family N-acetyltransferase [Staphylococcus pasteuri]|uniref:GNAT family N-acetyltransferase n=1 Tax=Staphylococcus TaxID=1279 RepID=UPI000869BFF1|nr:MULTISPECIES: GNAT family N-acetyltransferase [Staphylococcus]ODB63896.1 acetyltransferase [Staphylococcus sp. AOAB]RQX26526.1 N-acetyltransferase [Staphylococcus warneri]MCO0861407.1 GNAT family N-acetyltransferase [Staphylococcus pasteuri]MCO5360513.1 GNAT family N-acetyltransferase [Staphylococcus pasteuri]OFV06508.1 acetyltransferase [Staphylococcus sp. HMSC13A10]